jgi:glutaredoxin-like YruB-family protein
VKIKIYTISTCPWCKKTKEFFKDHNIKYKEVDVAKNPKAAKEMIEKSGQTGVPIIEINGEIITGFDVKKLKKVLKLK